MIRKNVCLLCARELEAITGDVQQHPEAEDCRVAYTDAYGIAISFEPSTQTEVPEQPAEATEAEEDWLAAVFPPVDNALADVYESHGLRFLGGVSTGRGWSSFKTAQRCFYLWKKRYVEQARPTIVVESPAIAIGTLVHAFLALHFTGLMEGDNPYKVLTPDEVYDRVVLSANPLFVTEAWRVFSAYRLYYKYDRLIPLAVEHDLRDPRTGESCRYDLIAFLDEPLGELLPGTYNVEHKTGQRFDYAFLEGWQNDGEVIGQNALWQRLGLDNRFGPLRGTIVNLIGKQKEPKFHRTFVASDSWRVKSHLEDLRRWEGLLSLCKSTNSWPRSRGNCIDRYGMCDWYSYCAGDGASEE